MDSAVQKAQEPAVPVEYSGPVERDDPLLQTLVILSRLYGAPRSPAALAAGLPIPVGGITPLLFLRAAERIGLAANVSKRQLTAIPDLALPCVLLLKDKQACVLLRRDGEFAEIVTTDNIDGSKRISIATLEDLYSGSCIIARPKIRLDVRSGELAIESHGNWFWSAVRSFSTIYVEVIVASLILNIFAVISPVFVMSVYNRVVPNRAFDTLWVLAIGVSVAYGFEFVMRTLRGYFLERTGKALDRKISGRIFGHVLGIRMDSAPQSSGAFANYIQQFEPLRDFFTSASLAAIVDLPFLFLFIFVISLIAGPVAIVPLVMIPLVIAVSLMVQVPMRKASEGAYRQGAQKHAVLVETIAGLDTIKVASAEGHRQRNWDGFVDALATTSTKARFWSAFQVNFVSLALSFTTLGTIIWGVYRTAEGLMTMGAMVATSMLVGRAMAPLGQIAGMMVRLNQSWSSLKGLNKLMDLPVERPLGKDFLRRPHVEGAIEFRNVSFRYPGQEGKALDGISFKIAPGERVAIVGRIGSGKTTIERLIVGLFEPEEGAVLVDGTDIRQLDPADLRRNIGCVLQDAHLFFGSVKDNIAIGAPYVDEASVLRAATIAGVDEFVRHHPHGYDMQVGENGRYLSGGQRQAVAIARSLLMNPQILVFDEPTSHMDNSTETAFKTRLQQALPGKTLVLVTHRNSMLSLVDRLIVIDGGKVVADGPKAGVLDALMKGRVKAAEA
jgi:ATP-binding cassette subfamily C protein LapB